MEVNKLTQDLLAKGYTETNYPDYVARYDAHNGGFRYKKSYVGELVYSTPCGLLIKGKNLTGDTYYGEEEWSFENGNPIVNCPYDKETCCACTERDQILQESGLWFCNCHQVEEPYVFEKSIEGISKRQEAIKNAAFEDFQKTHPKACMFQCRYDEKTNTWSMNFDTLRCKDFNCSTCTMRNPEQYRERGNIFYDLETRTEICDGSLFDGDVQVQVVKGLKFFKKQVSLAVCKDIVKLKPEVVEDAYRMNHSGSAWWSNAAMITTTRVINVRAAKKLKRNLEEDEADRMAGKEVRYAADLDKEERLEKKKRRQEKLEKAKERLRKKIRAGQIPENKFDTDYRHMEKWFSKEEIEVLIQEGEMIRQLTQNDAESWQQGSLFDYLEQED